MLSSNEIFYRTRCFKIFIENRIETKRHFEIEQVLQFVFYIKTLKSSVLLVPKGCCYSKCTIYYFFEQVEVKMSMICCFSKFSTVWQSDWLHNTESISERRVNKSNDQNASIILL